MRAPERCRWGELRAMDVREAIRHAGSHASRPLALLMLRITADRHTPSQQRPDRAKQMAEG